MVVSRISRRARAAAGTTLLLVLVYALQVPRVAQVAAYLGVLMVAGAVVGLFAAYRLWVAGSWDGRMLAAGLAVLSLAGHLVNLTLGMPGASALRGQISLLSVVAVAAAAATLVLVVLDARRRPPTDAARHPYAL